MRDPLSWSFPLVPVFGITVRVHWLFPVVGLGIILRAGFQKEVPPGIWLEATMLVGLLFLAVLLHEFGHCFGARWVDGDAHEVLLWPLGGLAFVEVPHTPRAHFIATAAGPLVNLVLCLATGAVLSVFLVRPPFNPLWVPIRYYASDRMAYPELELWDGSAAGAVLNPWLVLLARFFWVNWVLFLLNTLVWGYPLDGGRLFQCALWPKLGYRQATLWAICVGFFFAVVFGLASIVSNELLPLCLAVFIFMTCWQQRIVLEHGGEDSVFGYDFSQGYTSLERGEPPPTPRRRRQSWWQRWQQRRAARRMQLETEQREAEELRMDELLEKVQHHGLAALSDEERRFLKRVSDKYRNRP